jgi:hypothetical protein
VFAEPQGERKGQGYCSDLQCYNPAPCAIHQSSTSCCDDDDSYIIYYYAGFSGRAQPLHAMLAEAGAKWQRKPEPCAEKDCFARPMVSKGKFCIAQTGACAGFLGEELGFNHPAPLRHIAAKLTADISDIWADVYAKRAQSANWGEVDAFCQDCLADWFVTLDYAAGKYGADGYFLGNKISYVDFLWWNTVEVVDWCFGPERLAKLFTFGPRLAAIHKNVASRRGVAAIVQEEPVLYPGSKHTDAIPMKDY